MRFIALLSPLFAAGGLTTHLTAQVGAYRAPADTVYLTTYNPHRLYWVHGADTLGETVPSLTLTTQRWRPDRAGFTVTTHQSDLDIGRRVRDDTLRVDVSGHVTIPPGPAAAHAVDFTVHFPIGSPRLTVGFAWSDTTSSPVTGSSGPGTPPHDFHVARTLRVTRAFDTLGTRVVEIAAEGMVHYGDAWWADSGAKTYAWLDVSGPTHELYWFDPNAGRLIARRWQMSLRGTGGRPTPTGTDTTPAGLTASESERAISRESGHLLARVLPGLDTTYSFSTRNGTLTGLIFVHTQRFDTVGVTSVESGFGRADGMVGTVRATYDHARPLSYDAIWTDSSARPVRHHLDMRAGTIVMHEDRGLDTLARTGVDSVMIAPAGEWAVAEYAMDELLVPLIRTFARDTSSHLVEIFRPTPRRWDTIRMRVKPVRSGTEVARLATIVSDREPAPVILIVTADGVLLYSEDGRTMGSQRGPLPSSRRYGKLEALIKTIRRQQ